MATTVVNYKTDEYDVLVSRPSKWGNPFSSKKYGTLAQFRVDTREEAIAAYKEYLLNGDGKHLLKDIYQLKNKRIACQCFPLPCHADILAELANALPEPKFTIDKLLKK